MAIPTVTKESLATKIQAYLDIVLGSEHFTEEESQSRNDEISAMVPNSQFSDIFYHGDRVRTAEEMAEEALLREQIYAGGGKVALNEHLKKNYAAIFNDPDTALHSLISATQILEGIEGRELPELRDIATKKYQVLFPPEE